MRTALVLAAAGLLLAACTGEPIVATSSQTATGPVGSGTVPTSPTFAEPTASALTWGGSASVNGVFVQVDMPVRSEDPVIGVDGKPDPQFRFVMVPLTVGNKTSGQVRLSFSGRVGQKEAPWMQGPKDDVGEFLGGEGGRMQARIKVPADAAELVLEVHASVNRQPSMDRLTFKGPLP